MWVGVLAVTFRPIIMGHIVVYVGSIDVGKTVIGTEVCR